MRKIYAFESDIEQIIQNVIIDFKNPKIQLDSCLYFYSRNLKWLINGIQDNTVIFTPKILRFPAELILPCISCEDGKEIGRFKIKDVLVSTIESLTNEDAQSCYFNDKDDLITEFSRIHKYQLRPGDYISIYRLGAFFKQK